MKNISKIKKLDPNTIKHNSRIRLISSEGKQLGIVTTKEALDMAEKLELDLIEVAPQADPPVCRLMDYGKIIYQKNKKVHEAKKKQVIFQVKEVRIRPNTNEHDIQFKLRHIRRFLEDKNKAKISILFRGREIAHNELSRELLNRIAEETDDIGTIEQLPKLEGRNMTMIIGPKV